MGERYLRRPSGRVRAGADPDVPSVWREAGYVCAACGWPTETMPCEDHQPEAWKAANS
jgi:hypothetical protein